MIPANQLNVRWLSAEIASLERRRDVYTSRIGELQAALDGLKPKPAKKAATKTKLSN